MTTCRALAFTEDLLGEGPVFRQDEEAIYWTDIDRNLLQCWHFRDQRLHRWSLPEKIGSFGWQSGRLVLAMETGLFQYDLETLSLNKIFHLPHGQGMRCNDGKCDPQGRFWVGTLHADAKERVGTMYRLDTSGVCTAMFGDLQCPNGLAWSPDSRTMYFADSFDCMIYAFPFDPETGTLGERRVFADTSAHAGVPDGATVDADGYLWSAQCGGYALIRYAPDGTEDRVVPLPVQYPTSCAFGSSRRHIYVTTAIANLNLEERQASQPLAGALLEVEI